MYSRGVDPHSLAASLVDILRVHTHAPMSNCVVAVEECVRLLVCDIENDHLQNVLREIRQYKPDTIECRDARELKGLGRMIVDMCSEKEELANTVSDCDDSLMDMLQVYTDILENTHPSVAKQAMDGFELVAGLVEALVKEQKETVAHSIVKCLISTSKAAGHVVLPYLLDSPLIVSLASRVPSDISSCHMNALHVDCLSLLTLVLSLGTIPPLDSLQFLDVDFCSRLWIFVGEDLKEALPLLVNIHNSTPCEEDSAVIRSLRDNPLSTVGEKMIEHLIREPSVAKFKLMKGIFDEGQTFVNEILYRNDLSVLMHVSGQHLINEDNFEIRRSILRFLISVGRSGIEGTSQAVEAVEQASFTFDHDLVRETRNALTHS